MRLLPKKSSTEKTAESSEEPTETSAETSAQTSPARETTPVTTPPPADQRTAEERRAEDQRAEGLRASRHDDEVEVPKRGAGFTFKRTVREFGDDQCTDLAASLTYYSVLALFPAVLALLGLLGFIGAGPAAVDKALATIRPLVSASTVDRIRSLLESLTSAQGSGITAIVGIVLGLYSASAYVGAFSRMMNRIYEVEEGRPVWRLKPSQYVVTVVTVLLCAVALVMLIVSGPVAKSLGDYIGVGSQAVLVWNIAKLPVLLIVVMLIVAVLYHFTPNVKFGKFRWLSMGSVIAVLVWVVASVAFAFYVANFSSYNKTYGSLAGAIIALLWLWLTNLALLFGAEFDAERERGKQLADGLPAEERLQLPVRSDKGIVKAERKREEVLEQDRAIREAAAGGGLREDRPFARRR